MSARLPAPREGATQSAFQSDAATSDEVAAIAAALSALFAAPAGTADAPQPVSRWRLAGRTYSSERVR